MSENSTLIWIGAVLAVVIGGVIWFLRGRSGEKGNATMMKPATPSPEPLVHNAPSAAPLMPSVAQPESTPIEPVATAIQPNLATTDDSAEDEPSTSAGRRKAPARKKTAPPKKTEKTASAKKPRTAKKK